MQLQDLSVAGKRVLVRVDFNVPMDKEGHITDDSRIRASLPTIRYLLDNGAKVILMSHLGRPDGKVDLRYSLKSCEERLHQLLGRHDVTLLENLRFHKEEEEGNVAFAQELAKQGDCYVNDAFGTAHRKHASTYVIAQFFKEKAPGFLMEKEIAFLGEALLHPVHPFYAIIGGAKLSTKLGVLKTLVNKADALFIGGAMAYTFLRAAGQETGKSLVEESFLQEAATLLRTGRIHLPLDHVLSDGRLVKEIPPEGQGADIGPETVADWTKQLENAKTIFWNGPLGIFEDTRFSAGTKKIGQAITRGNAITIVGGGDSVAAIESQGLASKITHLSTGGGASLEYIEKGSLPGIDALK